MESVKRRKGRPAIGEGRVYYIPKKMCDALGISLETPKEECERVLWEIIRGRDGRSSEVMNN